MLKMSHINDIREAYRLGSKVAQIARDFHVDEKTVRKYIRRTDFSPALPLPETRPSRLDPYKSQNLAWLAEDRARNTLQTRHFMLQFIFKLNRKNPVDKTVLVT